MSCEHEHSNGHGHGHDHDHDHDHVAPIPTGAAQSLWTKIDHPHITALNMANPADDIRRIFKKNDDRYSIKPTIKSDCDAQLIVHIPFVNVSVKLFSIILRTNGESYCPKTIRLWKNDQSIDFDLAVSKKPTFTIEHPLVGIADDDDDELPEIIESETEFVEHFLPRHIFSGVQHLTIFIEDVHGDEDELRIHSVELRGEFTELSKDPVITLYELAANPADHKNMMAEEASNYSQI